MKKSFGLLISKFDILVVTFESSGEFQALVTIACCTRAARRSPLRLRSSMLFVFVPALCAPPF